MLLLETRTYDGDVLAQTQIETPESLEGAIKEMRQIAKEWRDMGGTLHTCRLLNLSATEDDEEPDNVVAFVDENKRNPIVVVGKRLEEARVMLIPN